ncbi:hypothetical protein [Caballeronia sp. DA-9]|uniref:hypothetical protein n=1 Tax=Caballeronia sp. DA-9 TaxID=3436237 RepID=UPI003F6676EC
MRDLKFCNNCAHADKKRGKCLEKERRQRESGLFDPVTGTLIRGADAWLETNRSAPILIAIVFDYCGSKGRWYKAKEVECV